MLFIVPMWMNFLLRTYAWLPILGKNGVINNFLSAIGLNTINILYTDAAVLLGMVYNFLPFMILPIYTVLIKMDNSLIDAAADLGANKRQIFTKVIFPLSMPGVITGITMVFMPAVSTFVTSWRRTVHAVRKFNRNSIYNHGRLEFWFSLSHIYDDHNFNFNGYYE